MVVGGDSNVVVLMVWRDVAKLAVLSFLKDWEAVLTESAERGGGVVIC